MSLMRTLMRIAKQNLTLNVVDLHRLTGYSMTSIRRCLDHYHRTPDYRATEQYIRCRLYPPKPAQTIEFKPDRAFKPYRSVP